MAQPQWITPAGSLGTIPEGIFYSTPIEAATADDESVYYQLIAGQLPSGVQITTSGTITGVPRSIINVQGVPTPVSRDVVSKFAVRAYTTRVVNGVIVVNRLADRTFSLTVTGQDVPEFITPSGNVGIYYDGTPVEIQIEFTDVDPGDRVRLRLISGELPPGLLVNSRGVISGIIKPLVGPPGTAVAGYDATQFSEYPFDFSTRSTSTNYQFTLEVTDGKGSNIRVFEIYVYSKDSMSADTTDFTADNTWITADVVPTRTPVLVTPSGSLGTVRSDNFYTFKFDAIDFDGDPIEYDISTNAGFNLPPGLAINPNTGWFYGYIPNQGATELTYQFSVRVRKADQPTIVSDYYPFTLTITGAVSTDVIWLTTPDLGIINNGAVSTFSVQAVNTGGRSLEYRLQSGSNSQLPQGLMLMPSGNITGCVSFNTWAVDSGTTTFDKDIHTREITHETTFDSEFNFTVNAYSPVSAQLGYEVSLVTVTDGGSNYTSTPVVTFSAPPDVQNAVIATAGAVTIVGGVITAIAIDNPGQGYTTAPYITITGGGGLSATAVASVQPIDIVNIVSVFRRFTITVVRAFNEPYQGLYIKAMPPQNDRDLISQLVQNQDAIPVDLVYRTDDPNFGVASSVVYNHAFGLTPANIDDYVAALELNHYWKNLTLGQISYAQARNSAGEIIYEAVYSLVVDNLVNNTGESVGKSVALPYPIGGADSTLITDVYPNSLINMRNQVIDSVGQISPMLPAWMTSKQADGRVLGFIPAWVIAYVKPGQGGRVVYNIQQQFGNQLNTIDFKADRYEIDRRMTFAWEPYNDSTISGEWVPAPPEATTFDLSDYVPQTPVSGTIFDLNSTRFITPNPTVVTTDAFDRYILYPKVNILE